MELYIPLISLAVVAGIGLLAWAVAGARDVRPVTTGDLGTTDLRRAVLAQSARERALKPFVLSLANRARRLTPAGFVRALDRRITLAGHPAAWPLERVLSLKFLLGLVGFALGVLRFVVSPSSTSILLGVAAVVLGYSLPDLVLGRIARERQRQIRLELPDVLDQMTISVGAGLGFEAAMARAGSRGQGAMAQELVRTLQDMQVGLSRAEALRKLGERTEVPELRRFVLALVQAERYGLPIVKVLNTQAAELRVKRRQRAEERAMKIPVKIIFPVVLCFLPTLFVVLVGPAAIRLAQSL